MGSGFSKLKKQARLLEAQAEKIREENKKLEVTGSAGNGLVSITLNGEHDLKNIKIMPPCVDPNDIEGLQDLIRAAYTDAHQKIQAQTDQSTKGFTF